MKQGLSILGSPNLLNPLFSKQFNGVRPVQFSQCYPVSPLIVSEVMGRLDHLVEAVYDRFKDRYFVGESMLPLFLIELRPYQISRNRRRHIRNEVSLTDIQG
jgi:hypothetical protein